VQRSYPRLRRILVPLDFSGKSREALRLAAPLASKFGARLVLLHVLVSKADLARDKPTPASNPRRTAAHKRLRETALQFVPPDLIEQTIVRAGAPAREILEACRVLHADLLAITTEGRAGLGRWLKGSVSEELLRLAPCPVLTVRKT
jgi:nucleotide-binding universal stress UspA family protein